MTDKNNESAYLCEMAHQRAIQLDALREVGLKITAQLDLDILLDSIASQALELLGGLAGGLYLYRPERDVLELVTSVGPKRDLAPLGVTLRRGEGLSGKVWATGKPLIVDNYQDWEGRAPQYEGQPVETVVGAPIRWGDEFLGVLFTDGEASRPYTSSDAELLSLFASQAAIAIRNARLYEEAERRTAQLEALQEFALDISAQLELDDLLQNIVTRGLRLLDVRGGSLYLVDEEGMLEQVVSYGYKRDHTGTHMAPGEGSAGKVLQQGKALTVDNYSRWEGQSPNWQDEELTASLAVPLKYGERIIGTLGFDEIARPRRFDEQDVWLATLFAQQAAIAIENARLFKEAQRKALEQETLREAALSMTTDLEQSAVLEHILAQLHEVAPYDTASVQLLRDDLLEIVDGRGFPNLEALIGVTFDPNREDNPNREVIRTRKPYIVDDAPTAYEGFRQEPHVQAGARSWLGAPMIVGDRLIGMIALDKREKGFYTVEHARLAEAFAAQAAVAIENAQLYQELRGYAGQLETRVKERTAQLEAILDSTVDGIVVTDADGAFILVNRVARNWLDQTLSTDEAKRLRETIRKRGKQALNHQSKPRAKKQARKVLELSNLDLELSASIIADPDASQAKAVVAIHDVSHLKALDRMKSQFVSNVSHELRTPITTIKLYAHLMKDQPQNWQEYLDHLTWEADHQAKLVEDILDISRVDAGRLTLQPTPTDMGELVEILIKSHETLIQERGLTLEYRKMAQSAIVLLDPQRILQVLNNLASNAIRYTPQGGGLTISVEETEAQGRWWAAVTVSDTGIGIPKEELPHIFERFYRGERPQAMQISGTGLGLAIAKEIVLLHGGRITVESKVGLGSAFTVWLPLVPMA